MTSRAFRGIRGKTKVLTGNPLAQSNVYRMIRRRETPLYDRRDDEVAVDEVARLLIWRAQWIEAGPRRRTSALRTGGVARSWPQLRWEHLLG